MVQKKFIPLILAGFAFLLLLVSFAPNSSWFLWTKLLLIVLFCAVFYWLLAQDGVSVMERTEIDVPAQQEPEENLLRLQNLDDERAIEALFEEYLKTALPLIQQVLVADTVVFAFANYARRRFHLRHWVSRFPDQIVAQKQLEMENNLMTLILKHRKGVVEPDLPDNSRLLPYYKPELDEKPCSFLGAPVYFNNHIVGLLCCDSRAKQSFSEEDLTLLEQMAALFSLQLAASNKLYEYEAENWISSVLYRFSREVLAIRDEEELVRFVGRFSKEVFRANRVAVCERTPEGEARIAFLGGDFPQLSEGQVFPLTEGIVGWVFRKNQSLRVEDFSSRDHYIARFHTRETPARAYRSLLTVPVQVGKTVHYVILLENFAPGSFQEMHKQVLETMANLVALVRQKLAGSARRAGGRKGVGEAGESHTQLNLKFDTLEPDREN